MAIKPKSIVASADARLNTGYRCPGCGEIVDSGALAEVLRHHQHVIALVEFPPRWFQRQPEDSRSAATVSGVTRPASTNSADAKSVDLRSLRYGHSR